MSVYPGLVPVTDVHGWKTEATQRLLGYTIALTEEAWHEPSLLPGWSRAHVATHLARNADHVRSIIEAAVAGRPQPPHPDSERVRRELEIGADRSGLELQIDLDSSAGALQTAIEAVTDWTPTVVIDGAPLPLSAVPLMRLHEVYLHHLDLDCGFTADGVDPDAAAWLLRWTLFRLRAADLPAIQLQTESLADEIGEGDSQLRVRGTDARVWAWLTGRAGPEVVDGADGVRLPLLG
jgi:maleylpyruvate isomerase